ncbi:protein SON isoform X2 [Hemicordylus capensis]|uniref:protein SON isoform X2 n=1 Tax=Hemicordylus capensis TaxID=884348 RepID=UPI0023037BC2|nr:protein SON isoform X2 [Hemicordylus capensis]
MATNIEQIFRSFVVSKFREIQEQQFGSEKVGGQQNGEINSSEQISPSDDTIASIGNLQNDPLVQKIEQVLSEVLGAESQYKPDGEDTVRNKSHSSKRGLSDEVQDEIPRKKSKKDKKHKDKKKKKKRKKEKKYKKQSKESKLNAEHKASEDMQPVSHSKPESSSSVLSAEDMDLGSVSPLKQSSEWFMEKTVFENLNSTVSDSHDAFSSDTSKLDTSEEDSTLISAQELNEVEPTSDRELQDDTCRHISLAVNLHIEDDSLNVPDVESGAVCMDKDGVVSIKEIEQPEASSTLEAKEKVTSVENSPKSTALELEDLETSLESDTVEVKDLDAVAQFLHPESMIQSTATSFEKTSCTFMKSPLEAVVEAKDSVTTLGFLAMVVGKDFEATSEFLNTAKVKASERNLKHDAVIDMKDLRVQDSERIVLIKDLDKNLQTDSRAEKKDLEATPESLHVVTEKDFEPGLVQKLKIQPEVSKGTMESDVHKRTESTLDAEAVRKLKETRPSAIMMKLKESEKYPKPLEVAALRKTLELEDMNRMGLGAKLSDAAVEVKNLETASEFEEVDPGFSKAECVAEIENWNTIPKSLRMVHVRNLDSSSEFEGEIQANYLETSLETVTEKRGDSKIIEDSEAMVGVNISESISGSGKVAEINNSEVASETSDTVNKQYLEVSKYITVADTQRLNLKDLEKVPESLMTMKTLESISELQYMKGTQNENILQSDAVAQRKDSETSLEPGKKREEKDLDATSESLHMIFTNYSEHSLELYTEPDSMTASSSETFPELFPVVDASRSEALHTRETKDLKMVESETMHRLNVLKKKLKSMQGDVKTLEATSEFKEMPTVKGSKKLVVSEAVTKRKRIETASFSVIEIEEKASDAIEYVGKDRNGSETDFDILPGCQKVAEDSEKDPERIAENEPSAEIEGPFTLSKSLPEMGVVSSGAAPELGTVKELQELKEIVGFARMVDVGGPKKTLEMETLASVDSKDASELVNITKDFELVSECHAERNLESLQLVKTQVSEVNVDSLRALEVKYSGTHPGFLFSHELSNLKNTQELEERTETTGSIAPESLYVTQRDLIIDPESDETELMNSERRPESAYIAKTNPENILKSLYMIQVKDSKSASESRVMGVKDLEIDSESSLGAIVEIGENLSECEPAVVSELLEITSESPRKNEMPLESHRLSVLQVSDAALRSEVLTDKDLEVDSETICVIDIENLEVTPECEELEVVKKPEVVPMSLFALEMIDKQAAPSSAHAIDELKAAKTVETAVEVNKLKAPTESVNILKEMFQSTCIADVKGLEAVQKLEADLEPLDKTEINTYTVSALEGNANDSEAFQRCLPVVGTHTSDVLLTAASKAKQKDSGADLKPDESLVITCSEPGYESVKASERETFDAALSVFTVEVKDSGASSSFLDTEELKGLKTPLQFETTPEPLCVFKSRDSDDAVEPTVETKDLGEALNYDTVLDVQDPVAPRIHLNTPELKSSELVCGLKVTDPEGILDLKTTSAYLDVADLKPSDTTAEMEGLAIIDSEMHLSTSETKYVLEAYHYKAAAESEGTMEKNVPETTSKLLCMEDLETTPNFKSAREIKDVESSPQSVCTVEVRDFEESVIYEEVLDVSEITPGIAAVKDFGASSYVIAETVKNSETFLERAQISDLMDKPKDVEPVCLAEKYPGPTAEMTCIVDVKNSEANSGCKGIVELKDTEPFLKPENALTSVRSKEIEDFEETPKYESVEVKDLQVAQTSLGEEGLDFKGISKSVLASERQDLQRISPSVLVLEEKVSEESLGPPHGAKAKHSDAAPDYMNAREVQVLEHSKHIYMAEGTHLESAPECVVLTQPKNSEIMPQIILEVKDSEAASKPLIMAKEIDLDGTVQVSLKEKDLNASKPVCIAPEENLEASQQVAVDLKTLEAALEPVCLAEKDLEARQPVTVEVKDLETTLEPVHTAQEKDLKATPLATLEDQHSEAATKSSDVIKENEGSILKDKKSEKISSKSKDKSKSGKKTKKSRSKSPSKSKKRKKKSRSHSTSRQVASRRARSRSRNDSDSKKKHSTSHHKSRSKSADKKEGKESSLRSRRRRSRTSDHPKSRSKSVEKRETSVRSRRRRSRSSDHYKSRSRSIDRRDLVRTRRRLSRSSDNHRSRSRSRSVDKRETLIRLRRRRSRSSDHRKSRSQSVDKRETSTRTRWRRSRSSNIHRSRSRSVDKVDSSVRRRRRRSRSSDHCKSRSKSLDRRESSIRSRRRRSRSSDHRKSRSRSVDDKRETSVRTMRRRSRSSDNRKSRSRSVDKRESSVRTRRRRSRSYNRRSRSKSADKRETLVQTKRKRSRSYDNCKSRSKSLEKRDISARTRRRQSRSADKGESSVRTRRKRSRSSDNHKSRSRSVEKGVVSVRTRRRRSRSSDNRKSRSKSADKRETSVRTRRRRSRSSDNRRSKSKSVDKTSVRARQRRSRSFDHKSRSKSVDKQETSVRAKRRRSQSSDNHKSRSKSVEKIEALVRTKRRRSRSSDNHRSRSKSVDKTETSASSKKEQSKSPDDNSRTKSAEKEDLSLASRHRRSKSLTHQRSKSKSKSPEGRKEIDSSNISREKSSKSRSKSLEKIEGAESLEASVCNRTKSPEHHKSKSKSRSRSKSLDKTGERKKRSRSKGSKSSEPKSNRHRTASHSRRNRSRSLTRKRTSRSKSDHRSRSRSQTRSRSCSRRWRRTRSRSASRQRSLSRERRRRARRNRSRSTDRRRRRSDSRDSYRVSLRLRSRSRTPARLRCTRSTGRRRSTSTSPDHRRSRSSSRSPKRLTDLVPEKKEEKVTQKTAKETIMELTEKCKKIAQSQEDDVIVNKPHVSDEEEEEHPFINHPFKLNEPKPIFFNLSTPTIKPTPPKTQVILTKEFPVSSGSQHRKKEADSAYGEWVPVEKNKDETKDDVFPNPANLEPVDISSALNERTLAQKRLTENTFDLEAMCLLNRAQERIDAWAQLNSLPGQFTGSTGVQVLSSEQLSNSGPQAWIKKDQFLRAAPVSGGMGAQLMRKMGWREGEGLGKNKEGNKEPILVDFKTDRKGLVAVGEKTQKRHGPFNTVKDLSGKHPVSALVEVCNKRRWSPPVFVLVNDNGPDHRKHFLFKVMVNGVEHKPSFASPNKKHAKATAATVALQALGLVPKELLANATSFRSASHN